MEVTKEDIIEEIEVTRGRIQKTGEAEGAGRSKLTSTSGFFPDLDYTVSNNIIPLRPLTPSKWVFSNKEEFFGEQSSKELTTLKEIPLETHCGLEEIEHVPESDDDSFQDPDYTSSEILDGGEYPVTAEFEIENEIGNVDDNIDNEMLQDKNENTSIKDRRRKRIRNTKSWKENKRRELKEKGEEYVSKKGVIKKEKQMKRPCDLQKKCYQKFTEEQRKRLFEGFYNLSTDGQDQYIAETVKETTNKDQELERNVKRRTALAGGNLLEIIF
ncbi:unnamed protein product [Diabrotica balteata]|uniref:Uncharacterized protein n=1 Tax=Diabrotica balteata TaxID=107213 RepID=A0A9N9XA59_DIABA|nr:unnamed protein product [Diabrotica balteata]